MMHSSSSVGPGTRGQSNDINVVDDFGQLSQHPIEEEEPSAGGNNKWTELSFQSAADSSSSSSSFFDGDSGPDAIEGKGARGGKFGHDWKRTAESAATCCINSLAFSIESQKMSAALRGGGSNLTAREESSVRSETLKFSPEDEQSVHYPLFSRESSAVLPSSRHSSSLGGYGPIDGDDGNNFVAAREAPKRERINEEGPLLHPERDEQQQMNNDAYQSIRGSAAAIDEIQQDLGTVNAALHETWAKTKNLVFRPIVEVAAAGAHAVVPQRFSGDGSGDGSPPIEQGGRPSDLDHENQSTGTPRELSLSDAESMLDLTGESMPVDSTREDNRHSFSVRSTSPLRSASEPFFALSKRMSRSANDVGGQMHSRMAQSKLGESARALGAMSAHLVEEAQKEETIRKTIAKGADVVLSMALPTRSSLAAAAASGESVAHNVFHAVEDLVEDFVEDLKNVDNDACDDPELLSHLTAGADF